MVAVIPAGASGEWAALVVALEDVVPVCSSDPDVWFPDGHARAAEPVAACVGCPALVECLAFAVAAKESAGVWGGRLFGRGGC